jgi:hypothetical protein
MRSVADRNVVMRRTIVLTDEPVAQLGRAKPSYLIINRRKFVYLTV